jgi:hypothetical protein
VRESQGNGDVLAAAAALTTNCSLPNYASTSTAGTWGLSGAVDFLPLVKRLPDG